jgi:hypothetical protein
MLKQDKKIKRRLVAALVVFIALVVTNRANAGLRSAILESMDGLERAAHETAFLAPLPGNDRHGVTSLGPSLIYDPSTGGLSAEIPAATIELEGFYSSGFAKLYRISSVQFELASKANLMPSLQQTAYTWMNIIGPLTEVAVDFEFASSDGRIVWQPLDLVGPGRGHPLWPHWNSVVAAQIDISGLLPPGLSRSEVQGLFGGNESPTASIDYANHRGVETLHVPMRLCVIPETSAIALVAIAALILALRHPINRK